MSNPYRNPYRCTGTCQYGKCPTPHACEVPDEMGAEYESTLWRLWYSIAAVAVVSFLYLMLG